MRAERRIKGPELVSGRTQNTHAEESGGSVRADLEEDRGETNIFECGVVGPSGAMPVKVLR